jgi:hypothetical protein
MGGFAPSTRVYHSENPSSRSNQGTLKVTSDKDSKIYNNVNTLLSNCTYVKLSFPLYIRVFRQFVVKNLYRACFYVSKSQKPCKYRVFSISFSWRNSLFFKPKIVKYGYILSVFTMTMLILFATTTGTRIVATYLRRVYF